MSTARQWPCTSQRRNAPTQIVIIIQNSWSTAPQGVGVSEGEGAKNGIGSADLSNPTRTDRPNRAAKAEFPSGRDLETERNHTLPTHKSFPLQLRMRR